MINGGDDVDKDVGDSRCCYSDDDNGDGVSFMRTTKVMVIVDIGRFYTRRHIIDLDELGQTFVVRLVIHIIVKRRAQDALSVETNMGKLL